jgi:hypothetical protein
MQRGHLFADSKVNLSRLGSPTLSLSFPIAWYLKGNRFLLFLRLHHRYLKRAQIRGLI